MRLTSRIDYGLRAMLDLALNYGSGPIQNLDISRRQNIPDQYLKQILPTLRRRGLVSSARGPSGGHRLARPPADVTVAEVIQALEGGMEILELGDETRRTARSAETGRILDDFWKVVRKEMQKILKTTTLDDLCRKKRRRDQSFIYHI